MYTLNQQDAKQYISELSDFYINFIALTNKIRDTLKKYNYYLDFEPERENSPIFIIEQIFNSIHPYFTDFLLDQVYNQSFIIYEDRNVKDEITGLYKIEPTEINITDFDTFYDTLIAPRISSINFYYFCTLWEDFSVKFKSHIESLQAELYSIKYSYGFSYFDFEGITNIEYIDYLDNYFYRLRQELEDV